MEKPGNVYFSEGTHVIPQPYGCCIFNKKLNRYDIYNNSGYDLIKRFIDGNNLEETISEIKKKYPNIKSKKISDDVNRFYIELSAKGYVSNKKINVGETELFAECKHILKLLRAEIEITQKCNQKCFYCYAKSTSNCKDELSLNNWLEILHGLYKHGTRLLIFSGGEPFLYPDIIELLHSIYNDFIIEINTNGTLLNEEVVKQLSSFHVKCIQISIDSSTPKVHDKIRGKGTWERAVDALSLLNEYKIHTRVAMTIHKENFLDIENVKKLADEYSAEFFPDYIKRVGNANNLDESYWDFPHPKIIRSNTHAISTFGVDCQSKLGFAAVSHNGHLKPCNLPLDYFKGICDDIIQPYETNWFLMWYQDIPSVRKHILSSPINSSLEKNNYFHNCYLLSDKNG